MKKALKAAYLGLVMLFLYAPILVLIIFSFNESRSRAAWTGFTMHWYLDLLNDPSILRAVYVTLSIAVISAAVATVMGTLAAIGIHSMKKRTQSVVNKVSQIPILTPDIVTGISLMLLYIAVGTFVPLSLGYFTMLLSHIAFNTPYVIVSVMPKLKQMNRFLYEAALDLGASPGYALRKVILPEIMPGVVTGAILSFTLSLDDFVVSFFTSATEPNLSVLVFSMARRGIHPTINALSAIMFVTVLALLLIVNKRAGLENL